MEGYACKLGLAGRAQLSGVVIEIPSIPDYPLDLPGGWRITKVLVPTGSPPGASHLFQASKTFAVNMVQIGRV